jgi:leader peptidase (prepilin peptidase)/N-methyltransferase
LGLFWGGKRPLFSFALSSMLGAVVGVIVDRDGQERSGRGVMPFGPYIAVAATIWMFGGQTVAGWVESIGLQGGD